jgi:2-polyprenyl-6-methoxyphenol hydroxylase-like FAD-dependent oxidoreductase
VPESVPVAFKRLVEAGPPEEPAGLLGTACVLGGSIAGLVAARVLADHAHRVVVIERDEVNVVGRSRAGVPQDQQVHTLLPGGLGWLERWLPGFTQELRDRGATLARPGQHRHYVDGRAQVDAGGFQLLTASRPLIESQIRARVLALPNVTSRQAQVLGLGYRDGRVSAVHYREAAGETGVLPAELVVDALGRASKLSDWLTADGYARPRLQRLPTGINYNSALFKRERHPDEPGLTAVLAHLTPPYPDGVAVAAASAIENGQWLVLLMGYDDMRPGATIEAFQDTCAKLPPVFAEASRDPMTGEIMTYHQGDSRRRDLAGLDGVPAGLVSVGDAVASFNPIYGQGMSSAALHGSCLSEYLLARPDLSEPATAFFDLETIVVDAAWAISAGGDAARLDALSGAQVPEEVSRQRWALGQLLGASLADEVVSQAVSEVFYMLAHPATLADPALIERAVAVNQRAANSVSQ